MALPTPDELVAAYEFIARRMNIEGSASKRAIEALLRDARGLAESEDDEPAALFYALSRFPRAFPGAWGTMTALLTRNIVKRRGFRLEIRPEEIAQARLDVASRHATYEDIRAWFESRRAR